MREGYIRFGAPADARLMAGKRRELSGFSFGGVGIEDTGMGHGCDGFSLLRLERSFG